MTDYQPGDIIDGRYKVLRNGTLYDLVAKKFASGPQAIETDMDTRITHANAQELARRKHEIAREKAADGLKRAVEDGLSLQLASAEDAWGYVIGKQTELAISPEEGHASTQAAKLVGRAAGMLAERAANVTDARSVTINVTADVAERLGVLGARGWSIGDAKDFLELSEEEADD